MSGIDDYEWGKIMWFGNLKLLYNAPSFSEKFDAFSKIIVSVLAVAFVAAAFSDIDILSRFPEHVTVALGGLLGFVIGAAKFA